MGFTDSVLTTMIFQLAQTGYVPYETSSIVSTHWLDFVTGLNLKTNHSSKVGQVTYCCCLFQRLFVSSKGFKKNILFSYYQIFMLNHLPLI